MRNHRGNGASSRMEQRRNKADHVLNWMIGIISLLILAIGCIILIVVFNTSNQPAAAPKSGASSSQTASSDSSSQQSQSSSSSSSDAQSSQSSSSSDQVSNDSSASSSSSSSTPADSSHQTSYDIGTPDWNAQVKAISDATGIGVDGMTVHWLGNGGSPNSSLARVSPKSDQGSVFVVHLTYSNGKWQADHVQKPQ
ncbi:YrrS family protein [Sporolactobacillus vineae]|uniref:YrrS family protein n=1 Tax=Sporolactobacillus vineae TaxID=444463 RepID=UPI0002889E59|nr:YrrS family protein [Sporolactobacillus vineae]